MYQQAVPTLPEMLARLPLPSEVWKRVPAPVRKLAASLPALPRPSALQVFAAAIPAGLALGWLSSFAIDPEILQHGGAPYIERIDDGVRVELAYAYDGYPEDPAPFGYPERNALDAQYIASGIADAGQYAETANRNLDGAPIEGSAPEDAAMVEPAQPPQEAPRPVVIQVVPQDTPL